MNAEYDFSKGKRGAVLPPEPFEEGKSKITIRLDKDVIDFFMAKADRTGGKTGYQTFINAALREHMNGNSPELMETMRQVIREEIQTLRLPVRA